MSAGTSDLKAPASRRPAVGRAIDPRGPIVRGIRWLDRRGGLSSRRAERAYAGSARLFVRLHTRAVDDAVALIADRHALIVDIGSGPGEMVAELRTRLPQATVVGVEPSVAMRDISAGRGVVALDGRAEALPLDPGSVDLVVSTLSAHHWDDPVAAFGEIGRVLRPGGVARIYDVRFAGFGLDEARGFASAAGLDAAAVDRTVLSERLLGLRPYALITIHAPDTSEEDPS